MNDRAEIWAKFHYPTPIIKLHTMQLQGAYVEKGSVLFSFLFGQQNLGQFLAGYEYETCIYSRILVG